MSGTLESPEVGKTNATQDPKIKTAIETVNGLLNPENKVAAAGLGSEVVETAKVKGEAITNAKLAAEAKPFKWYTPKVIATEQTRENTEYGKLATADEIGSVVLAENGLILVGYQAMWKKSSSEASKARAALFLGSNQLKTAQSGNAAPTTSAAEAFYGPTATTFAPLSTYAMGLISSYEGATYSGDVTTGQTLGHLGAGSPSFVGGGVCIIFAAAGTYNISVQYKALTGSVTAKERKLWVATLG